MHHSREWPDWSFIAVVRSDPDGLGSMKDGIGQRLDTNCRVASSHAALPAEGLGGNAGKETQPRAMWLRATWQLE